jgi:FixJ family two-component response regulator
VIAIVDDDGSAREATMSLMRALGFTSEAYQCAMQHTSCLIAGVRMPGMTGLELHRRLVASGNAIPTV